VSDVIRTVLQQQVARTVLTVGQGPAGAPGGGGGASERYLHTQSVPSAAWVVNHNLGFRPNVSVTTLGGVVVWAEVLHVSINQAQVLFDDPRAGLALFS
jgi:hypothetical protein